MKNNINLDELLNEKSTEVFDIFQLDTKEITKVIKTVSAMLNTYGGIIVLGVKRNKTKLPVITGYKTNIEALRIFLHKINTDLLFYDNNGKSNLSKNYGSHLFHKNYNSVKEYSQRVYLNKYIFINSDKKNININFIPIKNHLKQQSFIIALDIKKLENGFCKASGLGTFKRVNSLNERCRIKKQNINYQLSLFGQDIEVNNKRISEAIKLHSIKEYLKNYISYHTKNSLALLHSIEKATSTICYENKKQSDIFISYDYNDIKWVKKLKVLLERFGFSVWIDRHKITAGANINQSITKGIKFSKIGLVILSENSINSYWVLHETNIMFNEKNLENKNYFILPILKDKNINIPNIFFNILAYDLSKFSSTKSCKNIAINKVWLDFIFLLKVNLKDQFTERNN